MDNFLKMLKQSKVKFAELLTEFTDQEVENLDIPNEWTDFSDMASKGVLMGKSITRWNGDLLILCEWSEGAEMRSHRHPNSHEDIKIVFGELKDRVSGKYFRQNDDFKTIQANKPHIVTALKHTLFIVRFRKIRSDDERY